MAWAVWRYQHGKESALKLHVKFNLLEEKPVAAVLKAARCCERAGIIAVQRGPIRERRDLREFEVGAAVVRNVIAASRTVVKFTISGLRSRNRSCYATMSINGITHMVAAHWPNVACPSTSSGYRQVHLLLYAQRAPGFSRGARKGASTEAGGFGGAAPD